MGGVCICIWNNQGVSTHGLDGQCLIRRLLGELDHEGSFYEDLYCLGTETMRAIGADDKRDACI